MTRRALIAGAAASAASAQKPIPIIDTHIHLFDTARPQGVPWPPKNSVIYKPALPQRYRELTKGLGIVGAVEVECSPWLEDNQWVLDVAAKDPIVVGHIGNLEPGKPEFARQLERFAKNPIFRGIRYGNLWGRSIRDDLGKPEFLAGIKLLAQAGLTLDTANPTVELLEDFVRLTDRAPEQRVVLDHLPKIVVSDKQRASYQASLRALGARKQVYVKVSAVLRNIDGRVPTELSVYKPRLDEIFETFGEDRVVFGSDWPNSDFTADYPKVLAIVKEYFGTKSRAVQEKYFWRNSVAAYRWVKRDASQPA